MVWYIRKKDCRPSKFSTHIQKSWMMKMFIRWRKNDKSVLYTQSNRLIVGSVVWWNRYCLLIENTAVHCLSDSLFDGRSSAHSINSNNNCLIFHLLFGAQLSGGQRFRFCINLAWFTCSKQLVAQNLSRYVVFLFIVRIPSIDCRKISAI